MKVNTENKERIQVAKKLQSYLIDNYFPCNEELRERMEALIKGEKVGVYDQDK